MNGVPLLNPDTALDVVKSMFMARVLKQLPLVGLPPLMVRHPALAAAGTLGPDDEVIVIVWGKGAIAKLLGTAVNGNG